MDFISGFQEIVNSLVSGGPHAIVIILTFAVFGLLYERSHLTKTIAEKDKKMDKIIDDYYKGNLSLAEALNSLKSVLYEIKAKF